jgi:hypothetical protein
MEAQGLIETGGGLVEMAACLAEGAEEEPALGVGWGLGDELAVGLLGPGPIAGLVRAPAGC